jgi:hypothetical protein
MARAFASVSYFDTTPFMTALHRQRLVNGNDGKLVKSLEQTPKGDPVDALFARNIDAVRDRVERIFNEARRIAQPLHIVPTRESPETAPSDPAALASNLVEPR